MLPPFLHHKFESHRRSISFGVAAHSSNFVVSRVEQSLLAFFGHTWSKTRRMACLTSQQSELSRSDIASTRLLCDPGVSNFWIPEDVFGKKDNQPGWALIVFQLSGTRWIGDVSKYTTSCKICIRIFFNIHIPWLVYDFACVHFSETSLDIWPLCDQNCDAT